MNKDMYEVKVDNGSCSFIYKTYNNDVLRNFSDGNEKSVMFETIDHVKVSLPPSQVIIEQRFLPRGER